MQRLYVSFLFLVVICYIILIKNLGHRNSIYLHHKKNNCENPDKKLKENIKQNYYYKIIMSKTLQIFKLSFYIMMYEY